MNKLKPCPFCGGEAHLYTAYDYSNKVQCDKCGCGTMHYKDEKEAVRKWNRRVNQNE